MDKYPLIQVNLTYRCNRTCSYCYAKNLIEEYDKDMSLDDFNSLLNWLEKNNIRSLNLTGGEPTLSPYIGEMLDLIQEKKFNITIFSNGLFPKTFLKHIDKAHSFLINYGPKDEYTAEEYGYLHKNLEYLKQKNKEITLAFNITDKTKSCDHVIEAVKKYNAKRINMDLVIPNLLKNNYHISVCGFNEKKDLVKKFLKKLKENNIQVKVSRPLPFCVFKDEKQENPGTIVSACSVGHGIVAINPDLTVFPCLALFFRGPKITDFDSFQEINSFYKKAISDLKWKRCIYSECKSCVYFVRKKCQGGCVCHKCSGFKILNKEKYTVLSQHDLSKIKEFTTLVDETLIPLDKMFGRLKKKIRIYLFNKKEDMIYCSGFYYCPEWATGFASKNNYYQYNLRIGRRLVHELCHVYIYQNKKNEIPLWLEEGFCEYMFYTKKDNTRLNSILQKNNLIPFDILFPRTPISLLKYDNRLLDNNLAYIQSYSLVDYLVTNFGLKTVKKLLNGEYPDFKEYFKQLTNHNFEDVERLWKEAIKNSKL